MCGKPAVEPYAPFCSGACADLDLGLWFRGAYRIPAVEPPDEMADDMADEGSTEGADSGREDDSG